MLTHVPLDRAVDDALAADIAARGIVLVPTLTMMHDIADAMAGRPGGGPDYEAAHASVATLHRAGVPVLVGTDANETPAAPASPPMGASLHDEFGLLVEAGLSPLEALVGATSGAATAFGLDDRDRLEVGARADLVLLAADPTRDVGATRERRGTWIAGSRVDDPAAGAS